MWILVNKKYKIKYKINKLNGLKKYYFNEGGQEEWEKRSILCTGIKVKNKKSWGGKKKRIKIIIIKKFIQ